MKKILGLLIVAVAFAFSVVPAIAQEPRSNRNNRSRAHQSRRMTRSAPCFRRRWSCRTSASWV